MMNTISSIDDSLMLLQSMDQGTSYWVSNSPPTVSQSVIVGNGGNVTGRTATATVLGADDGGETNLRYNWQATTTPTGASVSFSANGTNAAKNNTLTFSKAGTYAITVTITDRNGATTTSNTQFDVVQTLTSLVVRTTDNRTVANGATTTTGGTQLSLTVTGNDQFGTAMTSQPSFTWQSTTSPTGGSATLNASTNTLATSFSKAGTYGFRVTAGSVQSVYNVSVTQTLTSVSLSTTSGSTIDANNGVTVTSREQRVLVAGFDQFGNAIAATPSMTYTVVSGPTGGTVSASNATGGNSLTFNKLGTFTVRARNGSVQVDFQANVTATLTSYRVTTPTNQTLTTSPLSIGGTTQNLTATGLDQFGGVLASQPTITWESVSSPSGGSITIGGSNNSLAATFTRAGAYVVRAVSGSVATNYTLNVTQTLTTISLSTSSGSAIDANNGVTISGRELRVVVKLRSIRQSDAATPTTITAWYPDDRQYCDHNQCRRRYAHIQ
ncbi:MAG: hypothetical protein U0905_07815 [Pirellulales bacterium]